MTSVDREIRPPALAVPSTGGVPEASHTQDCAACPGPFLEFVSGLSSRLAGVHGGAVDNEIHAALRHILELFEADRCVLFRVAAIEGRVEVLHQIKQESLASLLPTMNASESFPWLFDQIVHQRKTRSFESLDELPVEAALDRQSLQEWGAQSLLLVPVLGMNSAEVEYMVAIASARARHAWPMPQISRLRLIGENFAGALKRRSLEEEQNEALRFEHLIVDVSSRIAGAWSDQIDEQINLALNEILTFTGVDQCRFLTIDPKEKRTRIAYLAHAEGIVPPPTTIEYAGSCPWSYDKTVNRMQILSFSRLDELPPEAAMDRKFLEALGDRSELCIPFAVDGVVRHVFALATNREERVWPKRFVERLKVLGGVFVNALGRKSLASALRRNARSLAEAQRIANIGSWEWDLATNRVSTSAQADLILGAKVESMPECMAMAHPEDAGALQQIIERSLAVPTERYRIEYRIHRPDGEERIVEIWYEFVRSEEGVLTQASGTIQDVTQRKRSEQELQNLRAEQWHSERVTRTGLLISSLSHELSQPLAAILCNAQAGLRFLARNELDKQEMGSILADIVADDKRAVEIIEALRVMLRRQKTERKLIDMADVVQDVLNLLRTELVAQQVETEIALEAECFVLADRGQIQQVMLNLMMNAIDAMRTRPAGQRRLQTRVWPTGKGEVQIAVRDTGVGISQEQVNKVFDEFWTTKSRGTGLGLSICRSIVESHGGRIWVESDDRPGSTFLFALPVAARHETLDTAAGSAGSLHREHTIAWKQA